MNIRLERTEPVEWITDAFFTLTRTPPLIGTSRPGLRLSSATGRVRDEATQFEFNDLSLSAVIRVAGGPATVYMEGFEGKSLEQCIPAGGVEKGAALEVLRQLARALDALHAKQIYHGTLRSNSVLVDEEYRVQLFDWALIFDLLDAEQSLELFDSLSPERLLGELIVPQSDQFALGILAHRLLTGKRAFEAATKMEAILARLLGVWSQADGPPVDGHEAFERVFSPDGSHRFPSCEQFVLALDRELKAAAQFSVLVARSMQTAPTSQIVPTKYQAPEGRRHAFLIATVLSIAAFLVGLLSWQTQRSLADVQAKLQAARAEQIAGVGQNGRMKVCNASMQPIQIRDLAVAYWDGHNELRSFELGGELAHGWIVAPNSEQGLSWSPTDANNDAATPKRESWDGSVLFYFLDIEQSGKQYLLSGAWSDTVHGCLALAPVKTH